MPLLSAISNSFVFEYSSEWKTYWVVVLQLQYFCQKQSVFKRCRSFGGRLRLPTRKNDNNTNEDEKIQTITILLPFIVSE